LSLDVTLDLAPDIDEQACAAVRRGLESVVGKTLALRMRAGTIQRGAADAKFRPIRSLARRPA
jgi:hypothetical protein